MIWELSLVLGHNFFSDLAAQLNATTEAKLHKETTELEQLKQDYLRLKEERDYLSKALDTVFAQLYTEGYKLVSTSSSNQPGGGFLFAGARLSSCW